MKLKKFVESKLRINKANGQINLNPPWKDLPADVKKKLRQDPNSLKALIKFVRVK